MSLDLTVPCKVKRISYPCCGMKIGGIYEGKTNAGKHYVMVKLEDGSWTSDHWAPGLFEFLEEIHEGKP